MFSHVFGPVPSRRLGYSLGVDVIPFKTCSYDCVYCQLGRTVNKTIRRETFVPVKNVLDEIEQKLKENIRIDYITISGSGEPTLYAGLDGLMDGIKGLTEKPVAVLTNGSLLWDQDVQRSLERTDLIVPSLDAGNKDMFAYVNRPCEGLQFRQVTDGLVDFCGRNKKKIWLEVFLLHGVTSVKNEIEDINSICRRINPERIQLNTVKRPPAESFAYAIPVDEMNLLSKWFDGNVEIIADFAKADGSPLVQATR
ncbi:MAG: radical SAM protein, partial [Spirochaetaceae bacterium]